MLRKKRCVVKALVKLSFPFRRSFTPSLLSFFIAVFLVSPILLARAFKSCLTAAHAQETKEASQRVAASAEGMKRCSRRKWSALDARLKELEKKRETEKEHERHDAVAPTSLPMAWYAGLDSSKERLNRDLPDISEVLALLPNENLLLLQSAFQRCSQAAGTDRPRVAADSLTYHEVCTSSRLVALSKRETVISFAQAACAMNILFKYPDPRVVYAAVNLVSKSLPAKNGTPGQEEEGALSFGEFIVVAVYIEGTVGQSSEQKSLRSHEEVGASSGTEGIAAGEASDASKAEAEPVNLLAAMISEAAASRLNSLKAEG
eukprot:scaffold207_cov267-Pinguiococcus_pyrenoidosus.AAC.13